MARTIAAKKRMAALVGLLAVAAAGSVANLSMARAAGADSGDFSVVTYNVSGLPALVNSAPTPRGPSTTTIGERITSYDLVNVQEDFNYHKNLYAADKHEYRTPTSGGAGFGSGLNTLSNFPIAGLDRVGWDKCSSGSGDCLTPKGYTMLRVSVADGVDIDVYNLHADAGDGSGDLEARAANLAQLGSYISEHSSGNAVIVMGDTNTRYTRSGDTIAKFATDNGLTDAWVQLVKGGTPPPSGASALLCGDNPDNNCEVVDKVLYRSGGGVTLEATGYSNEHAAFLNDSEKKLSDHDPITVKLSWTKK